MNINIPSCIVVVLFSYHESKGRVGQTMVMCYEKKNTLVDPFSRSNGNHYRTAEMAFIGLYQVGYGTMIGSIQADAEQVKTRQLDG